MAAKNPILTDPEVTSRFQGLPEECKRALTDFTLWLYRYSTEKAKESWRKRKAPMTVYWSSVKAWAFHIHRVLNKTEGVKRDLTKRDLILQLLKEGPKSHRQLAALAGTPRYSARILELRGKGYKIERTTIRMNSGNGVTTAHLYALVSSPKKEKPLPQEKLF